MGEWETVIDARPKFAGHRQPRVPLWGYMNDADPRVMEMKIDVAAEHGVNVFIYDWYWYDGRPFLEGALNTGYLQARNNHKVRFFLMWANHDATTLWDIRNSHDQQVIWLGSQNRAEFERLGQRLIECYFGHPSYYRINGTPVFCIYQVGVLVRGLGGVDQAADALNWLRRQAEAHGLGLLHLQVISRRGLPGDVTGVQGDGESVQKQVIQRLGIDSVTHYQWVNLSRQPDYDAFAQEAIAKWAIHEEQLGVPCFPHVTIGWDNSSRFRGDVPFIVNGNTPAKFQAYLEKARDYVDAHPDRPALVTINSLNEWSEASYLEPDTEDGYAYFEAVRRVFVGERS